MSAADSPTAATGADRHRHVTRDATSRTGNQQNNSNFAAGPQAATANGGQSSSLSIVFSASWVRLTTPIGEGAFSRVYEGVYRNPESLEESVVAVKILKKNMLKRRSDCLRFIKEAKIMTKISHRHIAACYGIGKYEDDDPHNPGSLFIVQELIRGGNLLHKVYKQMLNRAKCIYTSQEALKWMRDVASGMQYLHSVTDAKPMIIHRDLKLENIMLAPDHTGVISAKLVDFGLHKVIDDRIKKVVKRVISEASLGGRLGRAGRLGAGLLAASEDASMVEIDDELEAALAEQRAMVAASSVKPGVGPSAMSPLGGGAPSPLARLRQPPLRVNSRLALDTMPMTGLPEDTGEEERAVQEAAAASSAADTQHVQQTNNMPSPQHQQPLTNGALHGQPRQQHPLTIAVPGNAASGSNASSTAVQYSESVAGGETFMANASTLSRKGTESALSEPLDRVASSELGGGPASAGASSSKTTLGRVREPVKKQSSMQRLMAKMKEIKLRVTGNSKDTSTGTPGSGNLSVARLQNLDDVSSQQETSQDTAMSSPNNRRIQVIAVTQMTGPVSDQLPLQHQHQRQHAPGSVMDERIQRNVQLLDKLVAAQSQAGARAAAADDSGFLDLQSGGRKARPPPRRAVTMINEIRYNLTEAVGSWAYMAPEVVLGQPYNEKVDVFSFGVILFEVLNRKLMLVDEIKNDPRKDAQAYAERVARGFRPEIPKFWPETLHELITACWAQDPHCRPNFNAVVDALAEIDAEGSVAKLDLKFWSQGNVFI